MKNKPAKQKPTPKPPASKKPAVLALLLVLIVGVVAFGLFREPQQSQPVQQQSMPQEQQPQAALSEAPQIAEPETHQHEEEGFRMPPYFENPDSVALAPTKDPSTVEPAAQQAYAIAQRNPKLIAQMPCFCYCDRFGHTSLHDCFVSDHAADCDICMKEALEADQMDRQGISPAEIRSVIVAKHRPQHSH